MKYLSEDHKEIQSGKKLDDEGYMAKVEMDKIEQSLEKLKKVIKSSKQQLPAWVQSKITKATDYLDVASDYLSSEVEMDESSKIDMNKFNKRLKDTREEIWDILKAKENTSSSKQKGPELPSFLKKEEVSLVDKILTEMLGDKPGCDIKSPKKFDAIVKKHKVSPESLKKELKKGIKVEMEHTTDKGEAETIALHHLDELPDYYTRLIAMEKGVELNEETKSGDSNLRDWFKKSSGKDPKTGKEVPGWVQIGGPYAGAPCARQPGQKSTPKCGSSKMASELSDKEEEKAFNRKNRKDPNQPQKTNSAKPTYVQTELKEKKEENSKKDACYHKVKSRYSVWPSAYASGALVKCRKVGADNWGEKIDETATELSTQSAQQDTTVKKQKSATLNSLRAQKQAIERKIAGVNAGITADALDEANTRLPMQTGTLLRVLVNWRGKHLSVQMFFPQLGTPRRDDITYAVNKVYPEARVISYVPCEMDSNTPIVQVREEFTLDEDWQKINKKDKTDGMSPTAVKAYRRENPGSNLQTAVTEKNPTGRRKQRRINYCTRSKGQQEMHNIDCSETPDKPICKARRRWNCKN